MTPVNRGWSLDSKIWYVVSRLSEGLAWRCYPLADAWASSIPKGAGVYMIVVRPPLGDRMKDMLAPAYVGQSSNLRVRFNQHLRGAIRGVRELQLTYPNVAFWFVESPAEKIDSLEQALIDSFGPPGNRSNVIRATIRDPVPVSTL
jgi:hypothetical protein